MKKCWTMSKIKDRLTFLSCADDAPHATSHKSHTTYHTPHAQHRDQIMQAISFSWNWKEIASHVVAAAIFKAAKLTTNNLLLFFISFLPSYAKVTQIANLCRSVCSLRSSVFNWNVLCSLCERKVRHEKAFKVRG